VFVTEFSDSEPAPCENSMMTWFRSYDRTVGAAPDPSVFLG